MSLFSSCCFLGAEIARSDLPCNCPEKNQNKTGIAAAEVLPAKTIVGTAGQPGLVTAQSLVPYQADLSILLPDKARNIPLGIKAITTDIIAGPNLTMLKDKSSSSADYKAGVGVQAGLRFHYYFSRQFSVSPGILFRTRNAHETYSYGGGGGEPGSPGEPSTESKTKYAFSFISVPLQAEFHPNPKISLSAGPELNYLLSGTVQSSYNGSNTEKYKVTDNLKRFGLGIEAGVGYQATKKVGVEFRVNHRLSDLDDTEYMYGGGDGGRGMTSMELSVTCLLCSLLAGSGK